MSPVVAPQSRGRFGRSRCADDTSAPVVSHDGPLLTHGSLYMAQVPQRWYGIYRQSSANCLLEEVEDQTRALAWPLQGCDGKFSNGELVVASYIETKPRYSRVYRSADDGATRTKVDSSGAILLGKEQSILCLDDNQTVPLKTQIAGQTTPYSPLYRSADRGATWRQIDDGQRSLSYPRNLIQYSDGSIAMFNSSGNYREDEGADNTKAWRIRSLDGGLTWPEKRGF